MIQLASSDAPIVEVAICRKDMPFHEGEWHFALATSTVKRGFAVRVTDAEGRVGYGYGGEIRHDGETADSMLAAVEICAHALVGTDPTSLGSTLDKWDALLYGNRRAKAALELAVVDLIGRASGRPTHELVRGKATRQSVDVVRILQLQKPQEMASAALDLVSGGYRFVKIKLDGNVAVDVERVLRVREAVGDGIGFTVDANQSYDAKSAIRFAQATEQARVDVFEQPVHRADVAGLRDVRRNVSCWVEADESVATVYDVMNLVRHEAVDSISVKLPKMGGLLRSLEVASLCEAAGLRYRVGAAFGSVLYAAANMQFVACTDVSYACEVGEFEHLSDDPFNGPSIESGTLTLPDSPGLGVQLDESVTDDGWVTVASGAQR